MQTRQKHQGRLLCKMLKKVGYGVDLNPSALDWCFENQECKPMLMWLCENLRSSNYVSAQDLKE